LLGTHVIPEIPGFPNASLWYPELTAAQRQPFIEVHGDSAKRYWGIGEPFTYTPDEGYANFWWGISRSALAAMMKVAGFEIAEEHDFGPFYTDVLAAPIDRPSVIPDTDTLRRRHEERLAGYAADLPAWA